MGPLTGIRIIEVAGIGPGPFCAMLLADLGAEVLRLDRVSHVPAERPASTATNILNRGRPSVAVDLNRPEAVELVLKLAGQADVLIEGFRPGVMERMGLGPDIALGRNPRLVYGRMTGWGQEGPLSHAAGHDINYIALTGALYHIGPRGGRPVPPLNLVGDFGGGGLLLAFGVLAALVERQSSGKGQVIDAAMVDGASALMAIFHGLQSVPGWFSDERGTNALDGGAHYYGTYETADGKYVAVGAIEPQFYAELLEKIGVDPASVPPQGDRTHWEETSARFAAIFKTKTRDQWCAILEGSDACFAPVLSIRETYEHPHNKARGTFTEVAGVMQPAPAPRFSRTPGNIAREPAYPGQDTREALSVWGVTAAEIASLESCGAVRQAPR